MLGDWGMWVGWGRSAGVEVGTGPPSQKQGSAVGHIPSPARSSPTEGGKVPGPRPCPVVSPEDQGALAGCSRRVKENAKVSPPAPPEAPGRYRRQNQKAALLIRVLQVVPRLSWKVNTLLQGASGKQPVPMYPREPEP